MFRQDKKTSAPLSFFAVIIMLAATVTWSGCKKQPAEQTQLEQNYNESTQSQPTNQKPIKPPTNIATGSKTTLDNVIRAAKTWGPAYKSWYGKNAPDFTLADINGKQHKLSEYRGKNVMIIFWATWCPPCLTEIPHLIKMRKSISEDKLIMLAITNEKPELVKKFIIDQKMNYTVLLDKGNMPKPFGFMRVYGTSGVPCSFFIDPDGRIKIATIGVVPLKDIKAILQAESGY